MKFVLAQPEDQNMKRGRFSEEQVIAILNEHEAGLPAADLCRKHGVSDACIYNSRRPDDVLLWERMRMMASGRRRFGYRRLLAFLRREGQVVNHKKIFR